MIPRLSIKGDPGNQWDGIGRRIGDRQTQGTVTVQFAPLKTSPIGERAARFISFWARRRRAESELARQYGTLDL
jgi:hypothetical protein